MKRLKNKVAIITGAAGGMGEAMAKLFAEEGANVMATDVQESKLETWVAAAHKSGMAIACSAHDVTKKEDWEKVIEKTIALYSKIDILINNAGVYPPGATTETTDSDLWNRVININLTGPFTGSKLCINHMKNAGGGSIVNISSIAGLVGGNGAAYTASKGGLRLLTKDLAVELAKYHIRVNSIHPGGIITPMTDFLDDSEASKEIIRNLCPMERMGNAMEVAFGALFLASDEASYVTGAELVIDGGLSAR